MTNRSKLLVVILDGLGDLPHEALAGRTPLDAAASPVLDALAAQGQCGLVDPVGPGVVVETHAGTAPLLGLDLTKLPNFARGPVEAAGAGLDLAPGDIALRCNFATVTQSGGSLDIEDRRAGRICEDVAPLIEALNAIGPIQGVEAFVAQQKQHRAVLRLSGPRLSGEITDTDPGTDGDPQSVRWSEPTASGDVVAEHTAEVLNRFLWRAHEALRDHPLNQARRDDGQLPANALITRGAGTAPRLDGLIGRLGLTGALVAGDKAVLGLARLLGFTLVTDPGFTALPDSDPVGKVAAAREALETHDVVWLHYKATDIASHDLQPRLKLACIEQMDAALRPVLDQDVVVAVTADHTTDCNTGSHTADPVPTVLRAPGVAPDAVTAFSEASCARGGLGRLRSAAFLRQALRVCGLMPASADVA